MERAILNLRGDHESILIALRVLDGFSAMARRGLPIDREDLAILVEFLEEFVDRCHVEKEEAYLLPALGGLPAAAVQGAVREVLADHCRAKGIVSEMIAALEGDLAPERLFRLTAGYVDLARNHIQKENSVLFPFALRHLSAGELSTLAARFGEIEATSIGLRRREELRWSLEMLRRKHLESSWRERLAPSGGVLVSGLPTGSGSSGRSS